MRTITALIFVLFILTGCSVLKRKDVSPGNATTNIHSLSDLKEMNLTSTGFFIQKADVEVRTVDFKQKFVASIKFRQPDEYNISIRSRSGIEVARIYFNSDTVLVNDRISRILYYGKPGDLELKYGFNPLVMPLILGDYISGEETSQASLSCSNGILMLDQLIGGMKFILTFDCEKRKLTELRQERAGFADRTIEYVDFIEAGEGKAPAVITINSDNPLSMVKIDIGRIEKPWEGDVSFVPGNRYSLRRLR